VETTTREYLLAILADESFPVPKPGEPGFEENLAGWAAYNRMLIETGHWISGASLMPSSATTTVTLGGPKPAITDGPFAETKEQFAGFYIVSARDLDEALDLAAKLPIPRGIVEVRPVALRPDENGVPVPRGVPS
jgi:hypothetical protein